MNNQKKWVGIWLITGCVMIIMQILLGGITRLTGSGLSITEWKLLMGWLPPITEEQWLITFQKYQQFPQFRTINSDMDLSGFKWIFFWEYLHRLWARSIMMVFLIPFVIFYFKKWLTHRLIIQSITVFLLGALQGLIGWLMVKTGLNGTRLWVSPLSLATHLLLALLTYSFLYWMVLEHYSKENIKSIQFKKSFIHFLIGLCGIQIALGGLMAGSHAALFFPTWPLMANSLMPDGTINSGYNLAQHFLENTTFIQFIHRNVAYLLTIFVFIYWFSYYKKTQLITIKWLPIIVLFQAGLGIITLVFSVGKIPILWGVMHQLGAVLLLTFLLHIRFQYNQINKLEKGHL
jgi:cytochrome c oxidase assembly protein subunit 15